MVLLRSLHMGMWLGWADHLFHWLPGGRLRWLRRQELRGCCETDGEDAPDSRGGVGPCRCKLPGTQVASDHRNRWP